MVRIINGEIVSDDDPRVAGAQRRSGSAAAAAATRGGKGAAPGQAGYGRVASLLDPPATEAAGGRGRGAGPAGGGSGSQQAGPLETLAEMIGVGGRFVKIPGALGVRENDVPVIYLMIAGLMVAFGGWRAAALIAVAYIFTNQQGRR